MPDLADQIKELLSILDVVDPAAAEEIRSQRSPQRQPVAPNPKPANPEVRKPGAGAYQIDRKPETGAYKINRQSKTDLFNIHLTPDNMISGIIYSELIGKPVSRRRRRGRL